jgi:hypothetical protein
MALSLSTLTPACLLAVCPGVTRKEIHLELPDSEVHYLAEHVHMFQDLMADFTAGAPVLPRHFCPVHQTIQLVLARFSLRMNANRDNVVMDPANWATQQVIASDGRPLRRIHALLCYGF